MVLDRLYLFQYFQPKMKHSRMKKFRLPRKTKKRLRKGLWLYPPDEKGCSLMASPYSSQKDYDAYKRGELRNIGSRHNSRKR